MSEAMEERERYLSNPLRLLRCAVEIGAMSLRAKAAEALIKVDDAIGEVEFERMEITNVETPAATEEELDQLRLF